MKEKKFKLKEEVKKYISNPRLHELTVTTGAWAGMNISIEALEEVKKPIYRVVQSNHVTVEFNHLSKRIVCPIVIEVVNGSHSDFNKITQLEFTQKIEDFLNDSIEKNKAPVSEEKVNNLSCSHQDLRCTDNIYRVVFDECEHTHTWTMVGHQGNGHQECDECGFKKPL